MFDGRIMGERLPGETNERELGLLMAGHDPGMRREAARMMRDAPRRTLGPIDRPAGSR